MLDREAAIAAIMGQFAPDDFDRGNAEACLAGLREAGFAVLPADPDVTMRLAMAKADGETSDRYRYMGEALITAGDVTSDPALAD